MRFNLIGFRQSFRRLRADDAGSTAVEFAMLAAPLFYLLFGIIEFGVAMMFQSMLEGATISTSRLGKTGYSNSVSREDTLRAEIQMRTHDMLDMSQLVITSLSYTNFGDIGRPEPWNDRNGNDQADAGEYTDINGNGRYDTDMGRAGYGGAKDVVVYTVTYPWQVMTPIVASLFTNGIWPLTSATVVKNEPY